MTWLLVDAPLATNPSPATCSSSSCSSSWSRSSAASGRRSFAAVLSGLTLDFFFVDPLHSVTIARPLHLLALGLYVVNAPARQLRRRPGGPPIPLGGPRPRRVGAPRDDRRQRAPRPRRPPGAPRPAPARRSGCARCAVLERRDVVLGVGRPDRGRRDHDACPPASTARSSCAARPRRLRAPAARRHRRPRSTPPSSTARSAGRPTRSRRSPRPTRCAPRCSPRSATTSAGRSPRAPPP